MIEDLLSTAAASPWALAVMAALVFGDALLVVLPGEVAVTALGALAVSTGTPPLALVIVVAAAAAFAGDACGYLIGRRVGTDRWRWMQRPRVAAAFSWAARRLERSAAAVVFTARFIPFARIAVTVTAGATRVPPRRFLGMCAVAATGWAAYQALIGAAVALILPGGPLVAVLVSIGVALVVGFAVDAVLTRRARARP
ncbi:VTT domain-containing protein [Microbacterium sp. NPDC089189]|uniref:DedA family protein n=1 Tax=Microbacterium sp. NPDC089189 TaxID=3154972 RepID=UPI00343DA1AE